MYMHIYLYIYIYIYIYVKGSGHLRDVLAREEVEEDGEVDLVLGFGLGFRV